MNKNIKSEYIELFNDQVSGIKRPVPFSHIKSRVDNQRKIGIIFINGMNGTRSSINNFNYEVFKDKDLFTFENRAQGENKNFATKHYKKYMNDAINSIKHLINKFNDLNEWYLIGESWGGIIIAYIIDKIKEHKIKGSFFWNMPYKVKNVSPRKGSDALVNNLKVLINFVFWIPFKTDNPPNSLLTNNPIILRAMQATSKIKCVNTGVILACWKSLKKGWNNLLKNTRKYNFKYIQSMGDVMRDETICYKLKKIAPEKILFFEKGTHILSYDLPMSHKLFEELDLFIKKQNKN